MIPGVANTFHQIMDHPRWFLLEDLEFELVTARMVASVLVTMNLGCPWDEPGAGERYGRQPRSPIIGSSIKPLLMLPGQAHCIDL